MNLHLRQTGRTTRLLAQAVSYSAQGRAVYVYAHQEVFARDLRRRLGNGWPHIKIEVLPEVWDWESMRPNDKAHPNCVFLVDHAAVEIRLADLNKQIMRLEQLQRQLYALTT